MTEEPNKTDTIRRMLAAGWTRHNQQHKVGMASLKSVRSLNRWLREQDEFWVSPSGEILHWTKYTETTND